MGTYNKHPALAAIRADMFPYVSTMFPYEFMNYFYELPVRTPSGDYLLLQTTRYCSGTREPRASGRIDWMRAVRKHFDAKGWNPALKEWFNSTRTMSVFFGHGLPEELSLTCTLALAAGHVTEDTIAAWADKMLGIDCNGFVCAYLSSLGLFSKPLYNHPSYINVARPAKTVSEISYDSVIVTALAKKITKDGGDPNAPDDSITVHKVKQNPGDEGAHILVIDGWQQQNSVFWATDQPGKKYPGPQCRLYEIVKAPPKSAKTKLDYVWTIRLKNSGKDGDRLVYITRQMESF